MYDPKFWKYCENVTVKQFCEYLQNNIPPDAIMCVCGRSIFHTHLEEDRSVFSVDHDSLFYLDEYENHEAGDMTEYDGFKNDR